MKVRLLNLVALAAIATGAQGVAQETGDSLERALADLNNGVVAPQGAMNNVSGNGSSAVNISGDARIRNTWLNPVGAGSDNKNVDARARLNFAFDVNPDANAFVQFVGHENWGNPGLAPNAATMEVANINTGAFSQAWFSGRNVFFDGEEWRFGRSYYTLGSGRIIGTDEWDQFPSSYSGIWYSHPLENWNLNAFMITDFFSAGGLNGQFFPATGDVDLFGATVDYSTDIIEALGTISIQPYFLRMSPQAAVTGTRNWLGANITGDVSIVDYDIEAVWVDSDRNNDPSTSSYNAWAVDLGVELGEWIQDIPGNIEPRLELGAAAADNANVTINPVYHNAAGIFDLHNRVGRPGVWSGEADTYQGALALRPMEGWTGRIAYVHFNDNNSNIVNTDGSEIDLSLDHTFHNGVAMWLGWARVDLNGSNPNAYVVYGTLSLPF